MYQNIPDFLEEIGHKYPTKYALYIRRFLRTTRFTYQEVEQYSFKIANYLLENGVKPQDKVLIWAPNMPEWVLALFGCLSAGTVVVPVGLHSTAEVVDKYIKQTRPKILFLSKYYPIDNKTKIKKIFLEDLTDLVKDITSKKPPHVNKNELAEIVFTSGTTGEPKGVMISHHNILYEISLLLKSVPRYKHYRLLSILPLSHVMEQIVGLTAPLSRGATIYYLPRINTVTIKKALQKYQITDLGVVPQLLRMFLDSVELQIEKQKETDFFNLALKIAPWLPFSVRRFLFGKIHESLGGKLYVFGVGSAPLDKKLAEMWEAIGIKVVEGYGASETTGAITANKVNHRKLGSPGKKIPGVDIKLSSEKEILVKAENVTSGYYQNPEKTKDAFTPDGYFKTGDIGYFKDGYLYITGREKFKIVTAAGDKIYPEDIERKLNSNPHVWDSCVMGIKKDDGEIVYASIILKDKTPLEKIIENVNETLESNQKIMEYSVWPEKDFPRLHTLKVDRNRVKEFIENQKTGLPSPAVSHPTNKLLEILTKVSKIPANKIKDTTNIVSDLEFDSLKRVELVSLIEEELEVELDEQKISAKTTVSDLKKYIHNPEKSKDDVLLKTIVPYLRSDSWKNVKLLLQSLFIFPLMNFFVKISNDQKTFLNSLGESYVFIGNHPNPPQDVLWVLSLLPKKIRKTLVIPGNDWIWKDGLLKKPVAWLTVFAVAEFPMNIYGGAIGKTVETMIDFIDDKYNMLVMPEGDTTPKGQVLGELKPGLGNILAGTSTKIIPFFISGEVFKTFPQQEGFKDIFKHFIPRAFSKIKIKFGQPFTLESETPATAINVMRKKILELSNDS